MNSLPLVAHVLFSLSTGGMERVAVSLVKATRGSYRHAVIALTGFGSLQREIAGIATCVTLDKKPGKDWACYWRLWRTLRLLKPDLVQTYNIGTLDLAPVVRLAGVHALVHAEHGRDVADPLGASVKYRRLRRWMAPFIDRFVVVSPDLESWLKESVGIRHDKVMYIPNGIDTSVFHAARSGPRPRPQLGGVAPAGTALFVNVARLDAVKDQANLIRAFRLLRDRVRSKAVDCRLIIVGEGPRHAQLQQQIAELGLTDVAQLLGERHDVAELLTECDVFVLSSVAEGMPLTVLEAMAAGLPVVATKVGGIASLVEPGRTGTLIAPGDPDVLAEALYPYVDDERLRHAQGEAGRARVVERFSLPVMASAYTKLYDGLLGRGQRSTKGSARSGLTERGGN